MVVPAYQQQLCQDDYSAIFTVNDRDAERSGPVLAVNFSSRKNIGSNLSVIQ